MFSAISIDRSALRPFVRKHILVLSVTSKPLKNFHGALLLCRTTHDDVSRTRMVTLVFIPFGVFFFFFLVDSILFCSLNTIENVFVILPRYI